MAITLFDLDNTLLNGDSDYEWGQFLVNKNLVDADLYKQANDKFYDDYLNGKLDIHEFCAFTFKPLTKYSKQELKEFHQQFMKESIELKLPQATFDLIEKHRTKGDTLIIITATNSFITGPIAEKLGIEHLIATEPKMINGDYTTEIKGTPCFQEGKITRLNAWLDENNMKLENSTFYSDSHNDLPLMELVDKPIATNPDETLLKIAQQRGWEILQLHPNA